MRGRSFSRVASLGALLPAAVAAVLCTRARTSVAQTPPVAQTNDGAQEAARRFTDDPARDTPAGGDLAHPSRRTDHFRIGALGGVGFPRPLAIEGMIQLEKALALGVEYSLLPKMNIAGAETSFWAVAADVRVFPLKNAFFLGFRAGHQHLGGQATFTAAPYGSVTESLAVDTTFLNPRLGFLWTWEPGLTVGMDAGLQIPLGATASNTLPPGTTVPKDLEDVSRTFGKNVLPTIDLLRIGFLL